MPIVTNKTFLELVASYHQSPEKFLFFIGAGLSQPLFPSWKSLLKEFVASAKEGGLPYDETEILKYIENGENYLDVAEACVNSMGAARYRDLMETVFDKDFLESDIPIGYKALMELSPKTIITTNYDRIPDIAGKGKYRISTNKNAPEASRSFTNGKNIVFKIHGDITDQSSIVLTTSDYQKIINNNQSTKQFINSAISTKILIFIGFSLSDPHIDTILNNIKSINNDIPLSHYVLLDEPSAFKVSAFEKKYGVKIISYTPTDSTHPEVIELLRALNHEVGRVPEKLVLKSAIEIIDASSLIKYINDAIKDIILGVGFSVFYKDGDIHLSFSPTGETKGEVQKEIISIIKLMNFECGFLNYVYLYVVENNYPNINIDNSQPITLKAKIKFSDAKKYTDKEISTSTIWKYIDFFVPASISNPFQREERINFPMSMGIVEA